MERWESAYLSIVKQLFALLAVVAMIIGGSFLPTSAIAAAASPTAMAAHCDQSGMKHGDQAAQHRMEAGCCPAAAPAALPLDASHAPRIGVAMPLHMALVTAMTNHHPRIEIPPPRA